MDLSVLIISYNTRELTLRCLDTLYPAIKGMDAEVLVADNDSTDGSLEAIERRHPWVKVLSRGENLGFAKANNRLARHARGDYVLLLNPDTEVHKASIRHLVSFLKHREARVGTAIVGGRTYFADGTLNRNSCHGRPTPWSLLCQGTGLSSLRRRSALFNPEGLGDWERDTVRQVDAITGCLLLLRRDAWEQLGGFDERFVMYGEDTDLCLRAMSELGVPSVVCPAATIVHHGGASEAVRADKMVRLFKAKAQLIAKHWPERTAGIGTRLLGAWAFTRMAAHGALRPLRPSSRPAFESWREIWRRRAQYALASAAG